MGGLLEEVGTGAAMRAAWQKVVSNGGMPGIDRITLSDFAQGLEKKLERLAAEVRSAGYRPQPVMRVRPAFLRTKDRALVVPTVRDRVVHRAMADFLVPRIDPILSPSCRAFRRGRSAPGAADDVDRWIERGAAWVLRADVRSFFDAIRPEVLIDQLEPFVDPPGLRLLGRVIRTRVFDRDQVADMVVGIPQGSPLSPVLANLYLNELDHAMEEEYRRYLRYCDDIIVCALSEDEVREASGALARRLEPLGLELNGDKTRLCRIEDGFVFLGYQFGATGRGPAVKAVEALRFRLNELLSEATPNLEALDALYRGWTGYFGRRPECWQGSPAGALALMRSGDDGLDLEAMTRARWSSTMTAPAPWALELAAAWAAAGAPEQGWLELAAVHGGSSALPDAPRWAEVLEVSPTKLRELVRRLVGGVEGRLRLLCEAAVEDGRYSVAGRLNELGPAALGTTPLEQELEADPLEGADFPLLLEWFQGRAGVHCQETVSGAHRKFVPVRRPLSEADWRAHLDGERTLGLPLVRADQTVLVAVVDVDVTRKELDLRLGIPDELMGRALGAALRVRAELGRRGASALLELSGHKGYHLWLRLAEPTPAREVRHWLLSVVEGAGPLPEGIRAELFPSRDRVKEGAVGPLVKLPLGIHSRTGKRCYLLDERGEPMGDPFEALRSHPRLSRDLLRTELTEQKDSGGAVKEERLGPLVEQTLERCAVLRYVADKAAKTSYLVHGERLLLSNTLFHLGEQGQAAIHQIISCCYNYRREVTERHVSKTPPSPISCPRIRELHPQITASVGCNCRFHIRGQGYPTPVLHALKPGEITAFRKNEPSRRDRPQRHDEEVDPERERLKEAEAKVTKLAELKRHLRGIEGSIARLQDELAALFDEAGAEELTLQIGLLRRSKRQDGSWVFTIEV